MEIRQFDNLIFKKNGSRFNVNLESLPQAAAAAAILLES